MKLNILLLCNKPNVGNDANTIVDHIEAIEHYSNHHVWLYSNLGDISPKLELERFDVVIIHYSLCLLVDYYLSKDAKKRLREFKGLKVVFIQDEYRQINKMIDELAFMDIDVLFTCFPEHEIERIYSKDKLPKVSKYNNLTGYIPERLTRFTNQRAIKDRTIDVGYRGRKLAYWYGELAYEKWSIVDRWHECTQNEHLKSDISYHEKDRIYGPKWIDFLASCKTTLGVESGASVMDFTGELEKNIDWHQLIHPHESFYDVQEKFLKEHDGQYSLNQISPRCFEAIALKTVLVLYEGEYSGILKPWRHFIPLKKDFSNIQDVLAHIRDDAFLQNMADTAFTEIALNHDYSYQAFIAKVDEVLCAEFKARNKKWVEMPYLPDKYKQHISYMPLKNRIYKLGLPIYQRLPAPIRLLVKGVVRPKSTLKFFIFAFYRLLPKKTQNVLKVTVRRQTFLRVIAQKILGLHIEAPSAKGNKLTDSKH